MTPAREDSSGKNRKQSNRKKERHIARILSWKKKTEGATSTLSNARPCDRARFLEPLPPADADSIGNFLASGNVQPRHLPHDSRPPAPASQPTAKTARVGGGGQEGKGGRAPKARSCRGHVCSCISSPDLRIDTAEIGRPRKAWPTKRAPKRKSIS